MATKRVVTSDDVMGSQITEYISDISWWSQASGQAPSAVEITWRANGEFDSASITFPNDDAARTFEYHMESYGVRCTRQ
jgi:hypothetical protein